MLDGAEYFGVEINLFKIEFGFVGFLGALTLPVDLVFYFAQDKRRSQAIGYFRNAGFLAAGFFYKIRCRLNTSLDAGWKQTGF